MSLHTDTIQTRTFLACLLNCSSEDAAHRPVTWQTFDDEKPGGKARGELTRLFHGPLETLAGNLEALSRKGAGIFVTVCEGDGKGRRKTNMKAARAWWADVDEKGAHKALDLSRLGMAKSRTLKRAGSRRPSPCRDSRGMRIRTDGAS